MTIEIHWDPHPWRWSDPPCCALPAHQHHAHLVDTTWRTHPRAGGLPPTPPSTGSHPMPCEECEQGNHATCMDWLCWCPCQVQP